MLLPAGSYLADIIPSPRSYQEEEGICSLSRRWLLALPKLWSRLQLSELHQRLSPSGLFRMKLAPDYAQEQYRLSIMPEQLEIIGGSPAALRHALRTLYQYAAVVEQRGGELSLGHQLVYHIDERLRRRLAPLCHPIWYYGTLQLPAVIIEDAPQIAQRGFMLDISRNRVPRMVTIRHLIALLALLKYNQLQLYTEHTFAYRGHRRVWRRSSPLRPAEIVTIERWARAEGIELVPNQNCLGHMERWLRHPYYRQLAECPDFAIPTTRNPLSDGSHQLVVSLLQQYAPLFRSSLLHVGCDEPWEFGQGRSASEVQRVGKGHLYCQTLNRMAAECRNLNKQMLCWGDIAIKYPQLLPELSPEIVLCEWGYEADHPFDAHCVHYQQAKRAFYLCGGTSAWNSIIGRWHNATHNIFQIGQSALRFKAEGLLLTEWGDNGHLQQWPHIFPALVLFANWSWRPPAQPIAQTTTNYLVQRWIARWLLSTTDDTLSATLIKLGSFSESHGLALPNATLPAILLNGDSYDHYRSHYASLAKRLKMATITHDLSLCGRLCGIAPLPAFEGGAIISGNCSLVSICTIGRCISLPQR